MYYVHYVYIYIMYIIYINIYIYIYILYIYTHTHMCIYVCKHYFDNHIVNGIRRKTNQKLKPNIA